MAQTVRRFVYHRSRRICSLARQHRWWNSELCHLYADVTYTSGPYKTFNTWSLHARMSAYTAFDTDPCDKFDGSDNGFIWTLSAKTPPPSSSWLLVWYTAAFVRNTVAISMWFNWIFCRFTCVFPLFQIGLVISSYVRTQTQAQSIFIYFSSITYLWSCGVI